MKRTFNSTKKFVQHHRVAIAIIGTSTVFVALGIRNGKILNTFLEEHNLLDEYYRVEG